MNWTDIVTPAVSIISIFISNWLGHQSSKEEYKRQNKENAYTNYYIPLMEELMLHSSNGNMSYHELVYRNYYNNIDDFLLELISKNIKLVPSEVIKKFQDYYEATIDVKIITQYYKVGKEVSENLLENKITASKLYEEIISISLKEGAKIANELGYPDTASRLFEKFKNDKDEHEKSL